MKIESFANGSYTSQSPNADCEMCVNWYPEFMESKGAKAASVLYPCPGFTLFTSLDPGPIRALWSENGRNFAVSGYQFYELFTDGSSTLRGSVAINSNPAQITSNGDAGHQLFITSGDTGYCYDLNTNTLTTEVTSGATMCGFLDGYFLVLDATTSTLKVSGLEDGTTWDPTQVAQRSQASDTWVGMIVVHSDIWLMGSQTSEVWYNAGTFPFPFAPRPGAFLQQGTGAAFSLNSLNSVLIWLNHNSQGSGQVYRSEGYAPYRISTHAVEFAIQSYETIDDAVSFTYQDQGHLFYVLNFPTAQATWVYDAATNLWHERGYWNSNASEFDCYRVQTHCHLLNNKHLTGDRQTGDVYLTSIETATDVDGEGIRRLRRFMAPSFEQKYCFHSNLQVYMETGVSLSTGQGSDPQAMLSWSNDGGHTFSSEIWTSAGLQGQYAARVMFRGSLGRARNRVYDFIVSDPIPWRLVEALTDVEVGTW